MTSMYDEPGTLAAAALAEDRAARWPGADRRRAAASQAPTCAHGFTTHPRLSDGATMHPDGQRCAEPALTPAPAGVADAHDVGQLDAAGLEQLHAIVTRAGVDPAAIGQRVHVARTRRGLIVMLTVYTLDAAGDPVTVLGVPDVRHVIRPVSVAELPPAWRRPGER